MLGKAEKKKNNKGALTVGALAAVGTISIFKKGKKMIRDAGKKIKGFFKSKDESDSD